MAESYKVGPGTLKFNAGADVFSAQVMSCRVVPAAQVETQAAINLLAGRLEASEEVTYKWTLEAKFLQDLASTGIVAWTWDNANTEVDFEYIPATSEARKITGHVRVDPIAAGGDARTRPDSDASWLITDGTDTGTAGEPAMAAVV